MRTDDYRTEWMERTISDSVILTRDEAKRLKNDIEVFLGTRSSGFILNLRRRIREQRSFEYTGRSHLP